MKSCYVLELSVPGGSARHGHGYAYPDTRPILARIPRAFEVADGHPDAYYVGLVFYGATIGVWVVQRGRFERFVDLRPHLTFGLAGGRTVRLDDADALSEMEGDFDADPDQPVTLSIDAREILAALPPLEPPLLEPGETLDAELDPSLEPETGTYLSSGSFDYGSWDLESGERLEDDTGERD